MTQWYVHYTIQTATGAVVEIGLYSEPMPTSTSRVRYAMSEGPLSYNHACQALRSPYYAWFLALPGVRAEVDEAGRVHRYYTHRPVR